MYSKDLCQCISLVILSKDLAIPTAFAKISFFKTFFLLFIKKKLLLCKVYVILKAIIFFFFEKAILRGSFKAHPRSSLLEFLLRVCVRACVCVSVWKSNILTQCRMEWYGKFLYAHSRSLWISKIRLKKLRFLQLFK